MNSFAARLLAWFDLYGRRDLPWQHPRTLYRVWISEVMLQQTQVRTVVPYFERFVARFPDLAALADASIDEVLALWSGLGYYSRARNLHRAAQLCRQRGELPDRFEHLLALPGIGRSTAGAILSQSLGRRHAILDGNVRRVLTRFHCLDGDPRSSENDTRLWSLAEELMPNERLADYTQAIMDLGATVCTRTAPACGGCPVRDDCKAYQRGLVSKYPMPRARRERPLRTRAFLWMSDAQQRVALAKRPAVGIWGGLFAFPDGDSIADVCHALRVEIPDGDADVTMRHEFTHFSLDMQVWCVRVECNAVEDHGLSWFTLEDALSLGLPQPVRRMIEDRL